MFAAPCDTCAPQLDFKLFSAFTHASRTPRGSDQPQARAAPAQNWLPTPAKTTRPAWRCHNYRYNHTFLNSAEAYLGFHLRRNSLGCRDLMLARPRVQLALPPTRVRDWGPHTLGMG